MGRYHNNHYHHGNNGGYRPPRQKPVQMPVYVPTPMPAQPQETFARTIGNAVANNGISALTTIASQMILMDMQVEQQKKLQALQAPPEPQKPKYYKDENGDIYDEFGNQIIPKGTQPKSRTNMDDIMEVMNFQTSVLERMMKMIDEKYDKKEEK